ncbi:uncharacterized protein TNCV_2034021 [Trichonephila clavipes]|nr:uncharacterized protein TNCV_2034021 [Trichonephila clavipes]
MEHFTNTGLSDMHLIYGSAEGNAWLTERLYREKYPHRDAPDRMIFVNLYHNLYVNIDHYKAWGYREGSSSSITERVLPQVTEWVLSLESEGAKMLSVDPDALAQPDTVREEKGLSRVLLNSADEMCEEKEETSVDVIKEMAKDDINPVILNKEPVNLDDEIEEIKHRTCGFGRI